MKKLIIICLLIFIANNLTAQIDKSLNELSLKELKKEAKINKEAQLLLADIYFEGKEIKQDYKKAYKLYLIGANNNNPKCQYMCGKMANESLGCDFTRPYGEEVPYGVYRKEEVEHWYKRAAENKYSDAQYAFGEIYSGKYDAVWDSWTNYLYAFEWYLKAAENDHPKAQFEVAQDYSIGNGTKKDAQKAAYWYWKAALNDNTKALGTLGYDSLLSLTQKEYARTVIKSIEEILRTQNRTPKSKKELLEDERETERLKNESDKLNDYKKKKADEDYDKLWTYVDSERKEKSEARSNLISSLKKTTSSIERLNNSLAEGYRQINAAANPNSYDARMLAAEAKVKYEAMVERTGEENLLSKNSNSNSSSESSNSSSFSSNNDSNSNNSNSGTASTNSTNSTSSNSSNGNSNSSNVDKNSNKQRKQHFKRPQKSPGTDYYSETEACEAAKSEVENSVKNYSGGKILSFSNCNCRELIRNKDYTNTDARDKRPQFGCEVTADIEINEYSQGLPLPAGVYYEGDTPR